MALSSKYGKLNHLKKTQTTTEHKGPMCIFTSASEYPFISQWIHPCYLLPINLCCIILAVPVQLFKEALPELLSSGEMFCPWPFRTVFSSHSSTAFGWSVSVICRHQLLSTLVLSSSLL